MEPQEQPQFGTPIPNGTENKSSIGSIIGTIIIIAIIVLGGLYFWGKRVEESRAKQNLIGETTTQAENSSTTTTEQDEINQIQQTSNSDDISSIEADLNATNIDDLDAEVNAQLE